MLPQPFTIRRAAADDIGPIVALCARALGWRDGEPNEGLFRWKHLENPFGASALWVAEHEGAMIGVRAMMRWRFRRGEQSVHAVRAVDTATDPAWQGHGVFRALTRHALDELVAEDVAFVFNTPNAKSRPGYVSMGWQIAGRVPVRVLPASVPAALRVARERTPAAKWSTAVTAGEDAAAAFAASVPEPAVDATHLATDRTAAFLRWRYGFAPLAYRVLRNGSGAVVFRVRERGRALELVIDDVFADDDAQARALLREARRAVRPDYVLATAATLGTRRSMWPAPRQGPTLALRQVAGEVPAASELALRMGDIELF